MRFRLRTLVLAVLMVACAPADDRDRDGLSDYDELNIHNTNPNLSDTDYDGIPDGAEVSEDLGIPNDIDSDGDGCGDGYEFEDGTDPYDENDVDPKCDKRVWTEDYDLSDWNEDAQ